jgi:hypothetical protein
MMKKKPTRKYAAGGMAPTQTDKVNAANMAAMQKANAAAKFNLVWQLCRWLMQQSLLHPYKKLWLLRQAINQVFAELTKLKQLWLV